MKFLKLFTLSSALTYTFALSGLAFAQPANFVHPGLLNSQSSLAVLSQLKRMGGDGEALREYRSLVDDDNDMFLTRYQASPLPVVGVIAGKSSAEEKQFRRDMFAAYYNAIRWVESGQPAFRENSISIMNAWASTFQSLETQSNGTEDGWVDTDKVEAAWAVPIWANAAEIILSFKPSSGSGEPNWPEKDVVQFREFLTRLHAEIGDGNCTQPKECWNKNLRVKQNNQSLAASLADMSLGVFNDDPSLYQNGLDRMRTLLPSIIASNGVVKETRKRDCVHPQYSVIALTQAAQIEVNQSGQSSILTLRDDSSDEVPLLAKGIEFIAKSLNDSGPDAPLDMVRNCYDPKKGTVPALRDGFGAIAERLYEDGMGVQLPELDEAMRQRPVVRSGLFVDLTDVTHRRKDSQ